MSSDEQRRAEWKYSYSVKFVHSQMMRHENELIPLTCRNNSRKRKKSATKKNRNEEKTIIVTLCFVPLLPSAAEEAAAATKTAFLRHQQIEKCSKNHKQQMEKRNESTIAKKNAIDWRQRNLREIASVSSSRTISILLFSCGFARSFAFLHQNDGPFALAHTKCANVSCWLQKSTTATK